MAEQSKKPGSFDLGQLFDPRHFEFEYKTREIPAERDARLRKEFLSFLFKDFSTYAVALLIVLVALTCCLLILAVRDSTVQEKSWAMSVLSSIFTGAVGFAFG